MNRVAVMVAVAAGSMSGVVLGDAPAITIYNQNFGVVRETIELDLKAGSSTVSHSGTTVHLEPDSVILRDARGGRDLTIIEQSFRNDPISQGLLLNMYEGKTIDFRVVQGDVEKIVKGKIVRSGYVPHVEAFQRYGAAYQMRQQMMAYGGGGSGSSQPIIEVDGKLRFSLPGEPIFPALGDDSILEPTLTWKIETNQPGKFPAELAYVTGGMSWQADYNCVAPESGDVMTLTGWVTIDNQTGKTFDEAKIKLVAGDVNKIQPGQDEQLGMARRQMSLEMAGGAAVTTKSFDEYHMYNLERPTTLRDRETKQVEFVRAENVRSKRVYVYDGAWIDPSRWGYMGIDQIRQNREYGTEKQPKIWVMREFRNDAASGLGMALPKGRMRFYRQDSDGQLEFTGENVIDHTPKDELVRVYTGDSFDLRGERRQVNFEANYDDDWLNETIEVKVRNHKKEAVEVVVVEHLYRGVNWEIQKNSQGFEKKDAQTIEFKVTVPPDGETVVTYTARYTW